MSHRKAWFDSFGPSSQWERRTIDITAVRPTPSNQAAKAAVLLGADEVIRFLEAVPGSSLVPGCLHLTWWGHYDHDSTTTNR
jgi:hypothetical protein